MDANEESVELIVEMVTAEDALLASGFPEERWLLIKQYLHLAITRHLLDSMRMVLTPEPSAETEEDVNRLRRDT